MFEKNCSKIFAKIVEKNCWKIVQKLGKNSEKICGKNCEKNREKIVKKMLKNCAKIGVPSLAEFQATRSFFAKYPTARRLLKIFKIYCRKSELLWRMRKFFFESTGFHFVIIFIKCHHSNWNDFISGDIKITIKTNSKDWWKVHMVNYLILYNAVI